MMLEVSRKSSSSSSSIVSSSSSLSPSQEAQIYENSQRARVEWLRKNGYKTHRENTKPSAKAPAEEQVRYTIARWRLLQYSKEKRLNSKTKLQEQQLHEAWLRKMREAKKHEAEILRETKREEARKNKKDKKKNKRLADS
ncbi:MAG TPA: hypothetical protein VKA40_10405 [Nitrososphaera sp.]|nr:hypothetical protein [Nitrososphaera sp.]